MKPLHEMEPSAVLLEYYAERRRRESPPSLSGIDPDAPKEKAPPSGRWEELIGLTRGCDPATLRMMYEASSSYLLGNWTCNHEGCQQLVQHEHMVQMGADGTPLMVGGEPITIAVTTPVPSSAVAKRHGIDPRTYKRMTAAVLTQVAENIGRLKGAPTQSWQDAMGKLRSMARSVWS